MQRIKKILVVALCCVVLCFDAGSNYVYAADVSPAYSRGKLAWDGVAWALLSALGIATGTYTGAVDYLTDNVWKPLVAHLKEKFGDSADVYIDKANNKSYVNKNMMQDALDWGIENNLWSTEAMPPTITIDVGKDFHHFYDVANFIQYLNGQKLWENEIFDSSKFISSVNEDYYKKFNVLLLCRAYTDPYYFNWVNFSVPAGGSFKLIQHSTHVIYLYIYDSENNIVLPKNNVQSFVTDIWGKYKYYNGLTDTSNIYYNFSIEGGNVYANIGSGEGTPAKDYAIDSGLTVPKVGEKIDDWLAAQDKVNGGSVGLLGNDVAIPSDVTGTGAAIDSLPLTIPSFADLVINGQLAIDDILSQGLVKANTGAIADTQSAAGAVAAAEDVAATGANAEANAISVDQAQTALKNLMQQGIDYIAIEIPNNFWNKIPFSIPYDIYLLIHGIFVGSSGGSKKAPRREASSGSNMPVGDPSNVGIEIDIPTVPLKYTEEKTEDTPPNFTFTLNIPYTTPTGQTANFNKDFTIETAKYNYFAKIIKFSIGLLWLSSVFQWLLAIFSKG